MDQTKIRTAPEMNENGKQNDSTTINKYLGQDYQNKRKRRSKNEAEGRNFMCECGKSYLSAPALTNHKKTKHNSDDPTLKRGRGRPRKNVKKK